MNAVKITCPKCKEILRVSYHTSLGHYGTDEALAIQAAIQKHICKGVNNEK